MPAVDECLHRGNHISVKTLGLDLESVRNRGERSMGPAGAAIHRNVLVEVSGQQAHGAVVQRLGKISHVEVLEWLRCLYNLTSL
jgi:hypothetical protein